MPIELPPGTAAYSDHSPPPRNRNLLVILGLIVGAIAILFWTLSLLADGLVAIIPPSVEKQLGALTVPAFEQLSQPSPAQDTLNQLLDRLEAQLPAEQRQNHQYQVLYIPEATVNAVAIPGDRVIIYRGLLEQTKSENELMMVLGHELGHFAHRDHLRRLGRELVLQLALAAFLGDTGGLQSIAVSAIRTVGDAQFSQSQEYQADEFGLHVLQATYGHVTGATDFFARMSQQESANIAFLATHPTSQRRVHRLEQTIAKQQYAQGTRSPLPASLTNLKS
jgi:predicted Zn-dependent protease